MEPRTLRRSPLVSDVRVPLADGAALAGLLAGPADGAPVAHALLVPGFTGSKEDFLPLLPLLAEHGVRALAVDQRGQHESPPGDTDAYAVESLARDAHDAAAALGDGPVHLLGHSFGGLVAQDAVRRWPRRWASLVLLCSGPGSLPPGPRTDQARLLLERLPDIDLEQAWRVRRSLLGRAEEPEDEVEAFLHRRFVQTNREHYLVIAQHLLEAGDRVDDLAAVVARERLPVLVAHGAADDAWSPDEQARMAARLDAAYAVVPDAAHSPAFEAPLATATLLADFWTRHSR